MNTAKVTKRFEFIMPVMGNVKIGSENRIVHSGNLTVWGEGMKTREGYAYDIAGVSYEGDIHAFAEFVNDTMKPPIDQSELHSAVINHLKFRSGDMSNVVIPGSNIPAFNHFSL